MIRNLARHRVTLCEDGDNDPVASLYLDDIRVGLLIAKLAARISLLLGVDDHDWKFLIDERIRAMLHLARGITFSVNVADLFELECSLECHREIDPPAEVEKILHPEKFL